MNSLTHATPELSANSDTRHGLHDEAQGQGPASHSIANLSQRERECLLWCALGLRTKQIAHTLDLADATANEYIASGMRKLGAKTRPQAVAILMQEGLARSLPHSDP